MEACNPDLVRSGRLCVVRSPIPTTQRPESEVFVVGERDPRVTLERLRGVSQECVYQRRCQRLMSNRGVNDSVCMCHFFLPKIWKKRDSSMDPVVEWDELRVEAVDEQQLKLRGTRWPNKSKDT